MARNSEKNYSQLNRFLLAQEDEKRKKQQRPPLSRLNTPAEIRKWIPSIKSEINYCLRQTSGTRNYPDYKIQEFQERLAELQGEYKRFVNKCKALDPSAAFYTPGEAHGYIGKRKMDEMMEKQAKGEFDRANKRMKYNHADSSNEACHEHEAAEYSNEDLFNPDGTFKELKDDAFMSSIDDEQEIATPLADVHSSVPTQSTVGPNIAAVTASTEQDDQDQPLYNFTKKSTESVTIDNTLPSVSRAAQMPDSVEQKEEEPVEGLSLLANYNTDSDEDDS